MITSKLTEIEPLVRESARLVQKDKQASVTLGAAVAEVERKLDQTLRILAESDDIKARDAIIELEQAADSAKQVARSDHDSAKETREAVLRMHHELSRFKTGEMTKH